MAPASDRCCKFGAGRSALSVLERWTVSDGCDGGVFDRPLAHAAGARCGASSRSSKHCVMRHLMPPFGAGA